MLEYNIKLYSLNYHLVQCIKYRKQVLDFPEIINELKQRTKKIEVLAIETDLFINNWKSATSKALRNKFKDKLWKNVFWSGSYCYQTTLDQVKKYVESQGEKCS